MFRICSLELKALLTRTVGADKVEFKLFHNYKHAADQLYSDENLGILKNTWMRNLHKESRIH